MATQWFAGPLRFTAQACPEQGYRSSEGEALLRRGCCAEALALLSRAVEEGPERPELWSQLGAAHVGLNQAPEAAACFERSLALSEDQPALWSNLGVLRFHAGELEPALAAFRRALARRPDLLPARRNACLALFTLGRDREAEELLPPSSDRWELRSRALKERGNLEGAMEAIREAIRLLEPGDGPPGGVPEAPYSPALARGVLEAARERLDGAGLPFFLLAGTLLGLVREGDLLDHDKDLDIGMAWDVPRASVVAALCAGGLFTIPWQEGVLPPERPWYRTFRHRDSGCTLDVFFFRPEGDRVLCGIDELPAPVLSRMSAFGLRDWTWRGRAWRVPDPLERYLEEVYGPHWRIPDPHYHTILSKPTRLPESLPAVVWMGYCRLLEALREGRWARAEALAAQLLSRREDPFLVELRERLGSQERGVPR